MRAFVLPFAVWVGVLQLPPANQQIMSIESAAMVVSAAAALAGLTVMVYRLGIWRQEMHNTKYNVGAEITRHREESTRQFEELRRCLTALNSYVTTATEQRVVTERWQARTDSTVDAHEKRLERVEGEMSRLEQERAA